MTLHCRHRKVSLACVHSWGCDNVISLSAMLSKLTARTGSVGARAVVGRWSSDTARCSQNRCHPRPSCSLLDRARVDDCANRLGPPPCLAGSQRPVVDSRRPQTRKSKKRKSKSKSRSGRDTSSKSKADKEFGPYLEHPMMKGVNPEQMAENKFKGNVPFMKRPN